MSTGPGEPPNLPNESAAPSRMQKLIASLRDPSQYAVLGAESRRGLKDLQDVVLQAFPDSKLSRDEPGTIGNLTPKEVYESKHHEVQKEVEHDR